MNNVAIVRDVYECFAKADLPAVLARFDPGIEWYEAEGYPNVGGRHVGHAGVVGALSRVAADWADLSVRGDEFIDGGDCVVVLGETSGTWRNTGKSFRSRFAHEWRLRDGLVVLWRAYIDTELAQEATRC